jgi:hypothetical protein
VTRLRSWPRSAPASCATRRLSASRIQLVAKTLAPMAQVRPLVREGVLEKVIAIPSNAPRSISGAYLAAELFRGSRPSRASADARHQHFLLIGCGPSIFLAR